MAFPTGFNHVRTGFVQAGDRIWVPALQQHLEVSPDSIYLGTPVDSHSAVYRADPATLKVQVLSFSNSRDRCDHLREYDSVDLVDKSSGFRHFRVVTYKDAKFVYLRAISEVVRQGVITKVCRTTGKVWDWTSTGWELKAWDMVIAGEAAASIADAVVDHYLLKKGEHVHFGD